MRLMLASPGMRPFWLFVLFMALVAGVAFAYVDLPAFGVIFILLLASIAIFYVGFAREASKEESIEVERSELASITSVIDDALIAYDSNFTVLFFNPAAERLFSLSSGEVVGKQIKPQDAEDSRKRLLAQVIFPSLAPQMTPRSEAGVVPQIVDVVIDDPALELRVTTSPIQGGNGFLKIIRNRSREIALMKAKNEFIAVASHQLRTPMNEVLWALQAVNSDKALSDDTKVLAEGALHSTEQLVALVDDILNAARIEEGRFGYTFAPADIVEFLGKVSAPLLPQAERAGIKLYFDRPKEPLPQVMIDEQKLSMVVTNLLVNALKYNVEKGEVTLGVKKLPNAPYIEVSVKDTGIGIPPEGVAKLFTKFYRAGNAVKSVPDGTGLGLFIAQNVVRAHGGQMKAESELNRGSIFSFTLPTDPTLVPTGEVALE